MLKKIREDQSGITLIELMVVITILGIIAGAIAISGVLTKPEEARKGVAKTSITALESALDLYAADVGDYPTTEEGLAALWEAPDNVDGWDGVYVKKPQFTDPWNNEYIYRSPTDRPGYNYEIISVGKDKQEGTEDDIVSWYVETEGVGEE